MSVLRHPRLYFRGEISWDPGITNNSARFFDPESVEVRLPPGVTIGQLKGFIASNAAALGIWNVFGTHDAVFENVQITGGSAADGSLVESDPIIGRKIALRGKLVDLDAAAANGSQVFFDDIAIGDQTLGVQAKRTKRFHGGWINFGRNLSNQLIIAGRAAATWQTCLDKSALSLSGADASPLLTLFRKGLEGGAIGLMIRFQTYRTLYFQNGIKNSIEPTPRTSAQLQQEYAQGKNFSNPAYSAVVGTIGLWFDGEPRSAPGGRLLLPRDSKQTEALIGTDGPPTLQPVEATLGPATIELDEVGRRLSLDLGAAIPERSPDLTKADLGALQLVVVHDDKVTVLATLGPEAYGKARYEAQAGIIDIELAKDAGDSVLKALKSGQIQLRSANGSVHLLEEAARFVTVEDRDVYLDQGEPKTLQLQVFERGTPVSAGHKILISEYDRQQTFVKQIGTVVVDSSGCARFDLSADRPGIVSYVFVSFPADAAAPTPPEELDPIAHSYVNVRTLPFDDNLAHSTPDENLRWSFIYEQILQVYDVINPVMARATIGVPLNDREVMMSVAGTIKRVTAKSSLESVHHMPVTRDMSAGRRKLLERWCDLVLVGKAPEDAGQLMALMAAAGKMEIPDTSAVTKIQASALAQKLGKPDFRMGRV